MSEDTASTRDCVTLRFEDRVAIATLVNPPLNIVSMALTQSLANAVTRVRETPSCRALVLTGSGTRAFCAGSDIREFPELIDGGEFVSRKLRFENETFSAVRRLPVPVIGALNNLAFGGGLELAMCCDLLVADERARFALPEISLGAFPGSGGTLRVARRVGEGRARRMALLGDPIDAATALDWGLIDEIAPAGTALDAALRLAQRLARGPAQALAACKTAINSAFDLTDAAAIDQALDLSESVFRSQDCREGVRAFLAKQPTPQFAANRPAERCDAPAVPPNAES